MQPAAVVLVPSLVRLGLQGMATVPSSLGDELDTNPFLRPNDPAIRAALGKHPVSEFTYLWASGPHKVLLPRC